MDTDGKDVLDRPPNAAQECSDSQEGSRRRTGVNQTAHVRSDEARVRVDPTSRRGGGSAKPRIGLKRRTLQIRCLELDRPKPGHGLAAGVSILLKEHDRARGNNPQPNHQYKGCLQSDEMRKALKHHVRVIDRSRHEHELSAVA